jgi:hypothetical protein
MKRKSIFNSAVPACAALLALAVSPARTDASSHMDAPLITNDPAANTADVYAFLGESNGTKVLQTALTVYPFEEPGIGPNSYNFDPSVLYQIHVSTGNDVAAGVATFSYEFRFSNVIKNQGTILQQFLGVVQNVNDENQNLTQVYTVTKVDNKTGTRTQLGTGIVPPNNQGIATPRYNVGDNGENVARPGVASEDQLDRYTAQSISNLPNGGGYRSFAGQREDGFYADVQSIFDLLQLRSGRNSFDSQAGFNVHTISLQIPLTELGGDQQTVGVYATTSRQSTRVLSEGPNSAGTTESGAFVQVARQGNPLFNEGLVAIQDKDRYSRTRPTEDAALFQKYASSPELAKLINAIVFKGEKVAPEDNRTDIVGIFIPDLIKVDLSTRRARLAGGGANFAANPDDAGFHRMGIFGGDTLTSTISPGFGNGTVPGGWPNGRRFGDDVVDIAVTALISDLRTSPPTIRSADGIDNVSRNDAVYNRVFPYASTPHNGRNHEHHNTAATGAGTTNKFQNISTRGFVRPGNNSLIGGVIIGGNSNRRVVLRGIGPSLADKDVPNSLPNPAIEVFQGSTKIAENDNWKSSQQSDISASGLAPSRDEEAAVLLDLAPGAYTVVLRGVDTTEGNALVEAYDIQ